MSEKTSSRLNSLVEYPLYTVVLVIKPPGSEIEFEIKRAGLRGENSLDIVCLATVTRVPPSHRLSGGSMQWLLRYETRCRACRLVRAYRQVHGDGCARSCLRCAIVGLRDSRRVKVK